MIATRPERFRKRHWHQRTGNASATLFASEPTSAPLHDRYGGIVRFRTDRAHAARVVFIQRAPAASLPGRAPTIAKEHAVNNDQVKGRVKEVKGKAKQVAGILVGDKTLEQKGKAQNAAGKVQAGYGDLKKDLKNAT
jgi:uncharacterized protein YjbJ (UPF0337 family)